MTTLLSGELERVVALRAVCNRFSLQSVFPAVLLAALLATQIWTTEAICQVSASGSEQVSIGVASGIAAAPEAGKANGEPVIPHGGRSIIFVSAARNLTPLSFAGNASVTRNIYRHDQGSTELISANEDGGFPKKVNSQNLTTGCIEPAVSDLASDGSYAVAFTSDANDLVHDYEPPGRVAPGPAQVYLRIYRGQGRTPKTFLISQASGAPVGPNSSSIVGANGRSDQPSVVRFPSADGTPSHRYTVCFRSAARDFIVNSAPAGPWTTLYCVVGIGYKGTNNGGNENNGFETGERIAISDAPVTNPPVGLSPAGHSNPQLSRDSSTLVFTSDLSLIAGRPNNYSPLRRQVYSRSMSTGELSLISFQANGLPADGDSENPSVSNDGRSIGFIHTAYTSAGPNVLKGFDAYAPTLFVRHTRGHDSYLQINTTSDGTPSNSPVESGYIDDSGNYAVFSDAGANMLGTDSNSITQVYFKELLATESAPGGLLVLVSASSTSLVGNNHSGKAYEAGLSRQVALAAFPDGAATRFATAFSSFAPNLSTRGSPTSKPFVFQNILSGDFTGLFGSDPPPTPTATPTPMVGEAPGSQQPRPLVPNAPITEPPAVEVLPSGNRKRFDIRIICQPFTLDERYLSKDEVAALATTRARIQYGIEIRKAGSRRRITQVSSRNVVTVRKLEPGRYTVRYRVIAQVKKKTIRSRVSPPASIVLS